MTLAYDPAAARRAMTESDRFSTQEYRAINRRSAIGLHACATKLAEAGAEELEEGHRGDDSKTRILDRSGRDGIRRAGSTALASAGELSPPLTDKAAFVLWGKAHLNEDPVYLERRFDRYKEVLAFNDLWTPAEKRAFLLTPRQEFVLPQDKDQAYVGHYLDIGFGVTITPPGTMGRMTSALQLRTARRCSRSAPAPATSRPC